VPWLNSVWLMTKLPYLSFWGFYFILFIFTSPEPSARHPDIPSHRHHPASCIAPFEPSHLPPCNTQRSPARR